MPQCALLRTILASDPSIQAQARTRTNPHRPTHSHSTGMHACTLARSHARSLARMHARARAQTDVLLLCRFGKTDNDDDRARRAWSARHAKYRMTLAWHTMISYLCTRHR
jgi:hypothetical protein